MNEVSAKTIVENANAGWQLSSDRVTYGRGFSEWKPVALQNNLELIPFVEVLLKLDSRLLCMEIGCDKGGTHLVWKHLFDRVISVDVNLVNMLMVMTGLIHKPEASHFIASNSQLAITQKLVAQVLKGQELDMLFIDGDHSYNSAESDYINYEPFVRSGGIVAFHDTVGSAGPKQFVQELTTGSHPVIKSKFDITTFDAPDRRLGLSYYVKP